MRIIKIVIITILVYVSINMFDKADSPAPKRQAWTVADSKAYARDMLREWNDKQFACLNKLWDLESNWRPTAYNKVKVMGKNAGGIPQLLGMSPKLPAPLQIDRGIDYIVNRYGTPCKALKFHQRKGWY